MDAVARRPPVRRAGPFVERDQVHLGRNAAQQLYQTVRVFLAVIHPVQHHIFKGDPFRIRQAGIVPQRVQQRGDVPLPVDRHQPVAHLIRGGMETDGQQTADFRGGARNFRHHAAGGKRDAAAAQGDALVVHHHLHRVADIVEIVQGFPHAHQHDVRDQPRFHLGHASDRPFAQIVARQHDLAHNLGRRQVAHQLLRAGVAEGTGQRAADLGRNAQRPAPLFGDIDRLHLMPAGNAHQIFARAVGADLAGNNLGQLNGKVPGQPRPEVLGQVGHLCKIAHPPIVQPLPDLAHAHLDLTLRRAGCDQRLAQLFPRQPDQIGQPALWQPARQGQHILGDRSCGQVGHGILGGGLGGGLGAGPAHIGNPAQKWNNGKENAPSWRTGRQKKSGRFTCSALRIRPSPR